MRETPAQHPKQEAFIPRPSDVIEKYSTKAVEIVKTTVPEAVSFHHQMANRYHFIAEQESRDRGNKELPAHIDTVFKRLFIVKSTETGSIKAVEQARELVASGVQKLIDAEQITLEEVLPEHAGDGVTVEGTKIPYQEAMYRIRQTLSGTINGHDISSLLLKAHMTPSEITNAVGLLAVSLQQANALNRFVGTDLFGVRARSEKFPKNKKETHATVVKPKQSKQKIGAARTKEEQEDALIAVSKYAHAYGLRIPVQIGSKMRHIALILRPRSERAADGVSALPGGKQWVQIKNGFHITEAPDELKKKDPSFGDVLYRPTSMVEVGLPNNLEITSGAELPPTLITALHENGVEGTPDELFTYLVSFAQESERKWIQSKIEEDARKSTPDTVQS